MRPLLAFVDPEVFLHRGLLTAALLAAPVHAAQLDWQPTFGALSDLGLGANNEVYDMVVYDDGSGPALYIAGKFDHDNYEPDGSPSGGPNGNIAKWTGDRFEPLGAGVDTLIGDFAGFDPSNSEPDGPINALAVFDANDGRGPGLYVAGNFSMAGEVVTENIARWDASGWSAVGGGLPGPTLTDLEVVDFGQGPELFVSRTNVVFSTTQAVAKWTPTGWDFLPGGGWGRVLDLQVFDGPDGPRLIAAGIYLFLPGVTHTHPNLAQWDGSAWSDVGAPIATSGPPVLHQVPSPQGNLLLTGGMGNDLFAYDGTDWTEGFDLGGFNAVSMAQFPSPAGEESLVLLREGASQHFEMGRWTGAGIEVLPEYGSQERVRRIRALDWQNTGSPELLMGGRFNQVQTATGPEPLSSIARWTAGVGAEPLSLAFPGNLASSPVLFDDGSGFGDELYVVCDIGVVELGTYELFGQRLLRWRNGAWESVVHEFDGFVHCVEVLDVLPGEGPELVVAGTFDRLDGTPVPNLLAYDGQSWTGIGGGVGGGWVYDVMLFEDGDEFSEPTLVVAGTFDLAGGEPHPNVAYWTGTEWGHFGSEDPWFTLGGAEVRAIASYDRGDGPELYAAGNFSSAGGSLVSLIARWSGEAWRDVGTPDSFGLAGNDVQDLLVHDLGFGEELIVIGGFFHAGDDVPDTAYVARTDGFSWASVGEELPGRAYQGLVFDDGIAGPRLAVSHQLAFSSIGGHGVSFLDGGSWTTIDLGATNNYVDRRGLLDLGTGALPIDGLLVAGREFSMPSGDNHVARWGNPIADMDALLGCDAAGARLTAGVGQLAPGDSFSVFATNGASPLASLNLYAGAALPGPCGVSLPGLGELLLDLALFPSIVASGPTAQGHGSLAVDVPSDPSLAGQPVALQGLLLDLSGLGPAVELTTGLFGTL